MTRPATAAVIGTGFIGPVHVEALRRAGVRVAGILGSSPAKSQAAADALGLPRGYGDLNELLADESVDAVHVASPNRHHFEQAAAAIRAGRHVLCEKPLAMTSQQTAELVALAASSDRVCGVAYNIRFYPLCHEAAARVRDGSVGAVRHVVGSYVQDWLLKDTDFNWRVSAREGGPLRAVADIGTHWLDLAQFVAGQPVVAVMADLQTVHATRHRPTGSTETFTGVADPAKAEATATEAAQTEPVAIDTDDAGCILLRFAGGARGCLHVSQTTAGRKNCLRLEVAGSEQSLAFDSESPNRLWIGHRDRANESLLRDPGLISPAAAAIASTPGGHNEGFPDTFKQLFRTFYRAVAEGGIADDSPLPTFADGDREVRLCEAILTSHRTQSWVEVDPVPEGSR